jgi:pimeloyl-ACP methyl ester carboxylesterase
MQFLDRPEGRIAYEVVGEDPHGRPTSRVPRTTTDLRGPGDSDVTFTSYGEVETTGDVIALIEELGGSAVVVGDSLGAGSAVFVAAKHPDLQPLRAVGLLARADLLQLD